VQINRLIQLMHSRARLQCGLLHYLRGCRDSRNSARIRNTGWDTVLEITKVVHDRLMPVPAPKYLRKIQRDRSFILAYSFRNTICHGEVGVAEYSSTPHGEQETESHNRKGQGA
jgi:hypothetical protein